MNLLLSLFVWLKRRIKHPSGREFTFKCPECAYYEISHASIRTLAGIVQDHMRRFHGR
jgi:hypothetical protein